MFLVYKNKEADSNFIMRLTIKNMEPSDSGVYYCNAQNNFGTFAQVLKLQARPKVVRNIYFLLLQLMWIVIRSL